MDHITLLGNIIRNFYYGNLKDNFIFSPASYLEIMCGLATCSKGDVLKEIFYSFVNLPETRNLIKNSGVKSSNYFLYSSEYQDVLNKEIIKVLEEFGDKILSLDFSNPSEIANWINNEVAAKTNNKITNLVSEQDINPLVKFILLNCVCFKKQWLDEFKRDRYRNFAGVDETVSLYFLNKRRYFPYYEGAGFDIVSVPYKDSDVCCYLLVPGPDLNLSDMVEKFNSIYPNIHSVQMGLEVDLTFPPFKVESEFDLEFLTKLLGAKELFNWSKDWSILDFDKLLPEATLKVDKIKQKCFIDLDERGTEAAAATIALFAMSGCMIGNFEPPKIKYIVADKPFLYVLANKNNKDVPLFIGVVNKLENEEKKETKLRPFSEFKF